MIKFKKPSEIILSNGRTLEQALESHRKWLLAEDGKKLILKGEDLSYANLSYADLKYSDLSNTNLCYANLSYAHLNYAKLREADLINVDLSNANLINANLSYAYLSGVDLREVDLMNADLSNANLINTDLSYADLSNANLIKASFCLINLYKAKGDFVGVENIGSRNDTTHYFYNINRVICGCFNGTMKEFENKVKNEYSKDNKYYKQYIVAIDTLKKLAELEKIIK